MALLEIKIYPDPVLKKKARPVTSFGPGAQKLFDDMIETMHVEDGVGLAAPQVGVSQRILIACPTQRRGEVYVVVNPELDCPRGRELGFEGCLSLPGVTGEVTRAVTLTLRYQDRHGKRQQMEVSDFFARIIQHENDHLDGILLIDRVDFNQRQQILANYQYL